MWTSRAASVALLLGALAGGTARADDTRPIPAAQVPDPGFLEFLGGVDGLADVNPNYLAQANAAHPGSTPAKAPAAPPPPAPSSAPGAKSDE